VGERAKGRPRSTAGGRQVIKKLKGAAGFKEGTSPDSCRICLGRVRSGRAAASKSGEKNRAVLRKKGEGNFGERKPWELG